MLTNTIWKICGFVGYVKRNRLSNEMLRNKLDPSIIHILKTYHLMAIKWFLIFWGTRKVPYKRNETHRGLPRLDLNIRLKVHIVRFHHDNLLCCNFDTVDYWHHME